MNKKVDEIVEEYFTASNTVLRTIYFSLGSLFTCFAVIGIWVPGWPTVSWAVPAAFLFSFSSRRMFVWTLTNRWFGHKLCDYYSSGKTLPKHAKSMIAGMIAIMSLVSAAGVHAISYPKDPGYGAVSIVIAGIIGTIYVLWRVPTRSREYEHIIAKVDKT